MKRRTLLRAGLAVVAMFTLPLAMQAGRQRKAGMIDKIDKSESQ